MLSITLKRILRANFLPFFDFDYAFNTYLPNLCSMDVGICWFRKDLRLTDNPAWTNACLAGQVIPVFVLEQSLVNSASSLKRDVFFSHLLALKTELNDLGGDLLIINGPAEKAIPKLIARCGAKSLYFNDDSSPFSRARDRKVKSLSNVPSHTYWGNLIHPPGAVLTSSGTVSKVFTPFYKKWVTTPISPVGQVSKLVFGTLPSDLNEKINVHPTPLMTPGSEGAQNRLEAFLTRADEYDNSRDYPFIDATSRLSSDLHFGTIGPREICSVINETSDSGKAFVRQLAWRDWYSHLLFKSPEIISLPANPAYGKINWRNNKDDYFAWEKGKTGYPIVDAGMRELNKTGFMHNRVRMITGSFLVKHLLTDWRIGEKYFRQILLDGDVSQNIGNWQWVAGTGFDAAPYFRIFNPVRQSEKFDNNGNYIRKWVPELADVDKKDIHAPWLADSHDLASKGVKLGTDYPYPIVDHAYARERCLTTYKLARENT